MMEENFVSSTKFQNFPLVVVIDLDTIHGHGLQAAITDRPSFIAPQEFAHKIYHSDDVRHKESGVDFTTLKAQFWAFFGCHGFQVPKIGGC